MKSFSLFLTVLFFFLSSIVLGQKYKDDGFKSEMHKKYAGKIVFGKEKIQLGSEDENAFINEYVAGESLYMRAYFKESFANKYIQLVPKGKLGDIDIKYNFSINNKLVFSDVEDLTPKVSMLLGRAGLPDKIKRLKEGKEIAKVMTTTNSPLLIETRPQYKVESFIVAALKTDPETTFKKGSFKLGLSIELFDKKQEKSLAVMSEGELTIVVNDVSDWLKNDNVARYISKDSELEKEMRKAVQNTAIKQGWSEVFQKVIIISDWWVVKHSQTGIPLMQKIKGLAFMTWPDGKCSEREVTFAKEYLGNGRYGDKIYFNGFDSSSLDYTPCSCYHK